MSENGERDWMRGTILDQAEADLRSVYGFAARVTDTLGFPVDELSAARTRMAGFFSDLSPISPLQIVNGNSLGLGCGSLNSPDKGYPPFWELMMGRLRQIADVQTMVVGIDIAHSSLPSARKLLSRNKSHLFPENLYQHIAQDLIPFWLGNVDLCSYLSQQMSIEAKGSFSTVNVQRILPSPNFRVTPYDQSAFAPTSPLLRKSLWERLPIDEKGDDPFDPEFAYPGVVALLNEAISATFRFSEELLMPGGVLLFNALTFVKTVDGLVKI